MLGKSFAILVIVSLVFSLASGSASSLAEGALDGASRAVTVVISLTGMMCLWSGVMNVLFEAGVTRRLAKFLSPLLSHLFPDAYSTGCAKEEIASALCANFLGIGNAATPLALSAMKKMGDNCGERASDDMIMLTLTSCAPVSLIPTTVITLRREAGCADPFGILVPVWICSAATFVFAVTLALLCRSISRAKRGV
ncbi:MAG: hypothetical protein IKN38_01415, partial [Clostridia bacterium]|nr:hypothetical protein [Clostridia bacterium]